MRNKENRLFRRWRASLPRTQGAAFVTDGAVDPAAYESSPRKILLLLKEVNDPHGGGWCLREFLQDGGRRETWNVVTRWLYAIRRLPKEIPWSKIEGISDAQRCQELRSIVAVNLKKIPGHHTTDLRAWRPVIERDAVFNRQQLALYEADLLICCGSDVARAFDEYLRHGNGSEWRRTSRGIDYLEYANRKYVVGYFHPEARIAKSSIHYGLVDAAREILCRSPRGNPG
jgi:hypothetical protein